MKKNVGKILLGLFVLGCLIGACSAGGEDKQTTQITEVSTYASLMTTEVAMTEITTTEETTGVSEEPETEAQAVASVPEAVNTQRNTHGAAVTTAKQTTARQAAAVTTTKKTIAKQTAAATQRKTTSAPKQEQGGMVWIPRTGSKYHSNPSCSKMKNPSRVSLSKAKSMGYGACQKCY